MPEKCVRPLRNTPLPNIPRHPSLFSKSNLMATRGRALYETLLHPQPSLTFATW
jgi:hypothetical protein